MKFLKFQKAFKIISDLKFGIFLLGLIALTSSFGSFIEQDESKVFYEQNYAKPIYGFINSNLILFLGLDHIYTTVWFLGLLVLFGFSLISCTISRQFPLFINSKEYFFKKKQGSFLRLPFAIKIQNISYFKEIILLKIQKLDFYIYQKGDVLYGYKGLIGRISPILVHFSLILILIGSFIGAVFNFKAQEMLPKGELFHIQNPIRVGWLTPIPQVSIRVNDFWVEYENNRVHQFYSNLSILNEFGNELKTQTISVNNPLRYKNIDFYQSDWNLIALRIQNQKNLITYEYPLFPLSETGKSWVTWVNDNQEPKTIFLDQLENQIVLYDKNGIFIGKRNMGDLISENLRFLEILPSTGLLIKYDPSIFIIYAGFGFLMITACLSYLPYTQIWVFNDKQHCWIGSSTNRGKIQLEIEFENLIRSLEYQLRKTIFLKKRG